PEAGGVRAMIWLNETERTWASTGPKKTWTGETKPDPMIVTRVFPSFDPEEGSAAVIEGLLAAVVPKAKQFGSEIETGGAVFVPKVRGMRRGAGGEVAWGRGGVRRVMEGAVRAVPSASGVPPAGVNVTRVVETLPKKRPPLIVRGVPPAAGPKLGLQKVKKGAADGEAWNEITIDAVAGVGPAVEEAGTGGGPVKGRQGAVRPTPPAR